jgi:hypothetical protein
MVTQISNDRDAVLRLMGMLQVLLAKLNASTQPGQNAENPPPAPSVSTGYTTKRRQITPQPDTTHEASKKSKNAPELCPKGCGRIINKPSGLSQHVAACTGEPWETQKKQRAQSSRSRRDELNKVSAADQPKISFLPRSQPQREAQ